MSSLTQPYPPLVVGLFNLEDELLGARAEICIDNVAVQLPPKAAVEEPATSHKSYECDFPKLRGGRLPGSESPKDRGSRHGEHVVA